MVLGGEREISPQPPGAMASRAEILPLVVVSEALLEVIGVSDVSPP